jgi:CheY-like chemotaxis protein
VAQSDGEGLGATFAVRLPTAPLRADAGPVAAAREEGLVAPSFECPPVLSGLHVLVVDDESETRDLLGYVLGQCGCKLVLAASAGEALAALHNSTFDVLVSDIGMPELDGYALIRSVRGLPAERGGAPTRRRTDCVRTQRGSNHGTSSWLRRPSHEAHRARGAARAIATLVEGVKRRRG